MQSLAVGTSPQVGARALVVTPIALVQCVGVLVDLTSLKLVVLVLSRYADVFMTISKRKLPLLRKLWVHCLLNCKVHSLHLATTLVTDWELVYEPSYASLNDLGRLADETRERTLAIVKY